MVSIDSIKHVGVTDILGRSPVAPKQKLLERNIKGKNILITGAGGSIGSELSRQIINLSLKRLYYLIILNLIYIIFIRNYHQC